VRVFLADHFAIVRDRVAAVLAARAMNIVGQADAPQACIDGILSTHPDVVVLDVELKGGTGLQVLRAVRPIRPNTAFVVFSIHAGPAYRKRYLDEGAWRFLDKATEFDQLANAVERATRHTPLVPPRPAFPVPDPMNNNAPSQSGSTSEVYALTLENERKAWQVLHAMPRSDRRYAQAVSEWQAAADQINVEAGKLLPKS
jgi:two-component system response regulator DesR